ncbi:MAG: hypothetical protein KIH67_002340 [Candidatus Moranbacteria bacterium]|nr:hypothetical protein [Candidatus Moranbacteria bacterium]
MSIRSHFISLGVVSFFVFFFALTLGATLTDTKNQELASASCVQKGGIWSDSGYCEKTVSVCTPETL